MKDNNTQTDGAPSGVERDHVDRVASQNLRRMSRLVLFKLVAILEVLLVFFYVYGWRADERLGYGHPGDYDSPDVRWEISSGACAGDTGECTKLRIQSTKRTQGKRWFAKETYRRPPCAADEVGVMGNDDYVTVTVPGCGANSSVVVRLYYEDMESQGSYSLHIS